MKPVLWWAVAGAAIPAALLILTFIPVAVATGIDDLVANVGTLLLALIRIVPPGAVAAIPAVIAYVRYTRLPRRAGQLRGLRAPHPTCASRQAVPAGSCERPGGVRKDAPGMTDTLACTVSSGSARQRDHAFRGQSGRVSNHLAAATSPYLQQHAENPVDWYEWGPEAFAEAKSRDVPLLISVGYAACHWCHVMAHESFEDEATAALVNARFVAVKVDREERPDVDAVYMRATQTMTGSGGWPMTVFATPDGAPFWCGTYFPPRPSGSMPSFTQVLEAISAAWVEQRDRIEDDARRVSEALADDGRATAAVGGTHDVGSRLPSPAVDRTVPDGALAMLGSAFDRHRGGFGRPPKFPPTMVLEWLLRHSASDAPGADQAFAMAERTLEAMARGGMADQLGGGFARYSVDAAWVVPHFEKMLSDNALLLRVYAHWFRATGSPLARRVVEQTAAFLLAELRTPEGGFASSLDADSLASDGSLREGAFYVWHRPALVEALGQQDGEWAADLWRVTDAGTFEHGSSVLQLVTDPEPHEVERYEQVRLRLLAVRNQRPRPGVDAKVVAAWNGLAIAALAEAGDLMEEPEWIAAAVTAADLVLEIHARNDGDVLRLVRTSRDGRAGTAPGVLEDYADLADGLLALCQATGEARWLESAGALLHQVLTRFGDEDGTLHATAVDETDPVLARIVRPRDVADGPSPSGQAAAAGALLTYAALTGSSTHREAAERALVEPLALATHHPRAAGWALAVAEAVLDGPREIAIAGTADAAATRALVRVAVGSTAPGAVHVVGLPGPTEAGPGVPILAERPPLDGAPTAYVCRSSVCALPTADPSVLTGLLSG